MIWLISTLISYVIQASIILGVLWYFGFIKLNLNKTDTSLSEEQMYDLALSRLKSSEESNKSKIRHMILNGFKKISKGKRSVSIYYNMLTLIEFDDYLIQEVVNEFAGNKFFDVEGRVYSWQKHIDISIKDK